MSLNLPDAAAVETAARERAARTFVQGLLTDLVVALLLVLATVAWDDLTNKQAWAALGVTLGKTAAMTAVSYALRKLRPPVAETATV